MSKLAPSIAAPEWWAAPGRDHVPSAYWFWHRQPTRDEICAQVADIAAGGFGTFLIQARLAYPIDQYLNEGFLAAYKLAMAEAVRHGLDVGIYDDYNWASGHAGGRTVQGRDDLRETQLFWATAEVAGDNTTCTISGISSVNGDGLGSAIRNWWWQGGAIEWGDWAIVAALAHPTDGSETGVIVDLTSRARFAATTTDGCTVEISDGTAAGHGSPITVFVSARCTTSRLINYLLPEAAVRFTQVGYDPFFEALGEYFGNPIKYLFIDHPQPGYYTWNERRGCVGTSLMYAPTLGASFEDEHGYSFNHALLSLTANLGPRTAKLRADFFETYTKLACDNFLGTISKWGRDRGIGLAGHEMLSHIGGWQLAGSYYGKTDTRAAFGEDFFRIDSYRTHTTVDASNFHPQVTARVGDSVARSHGRAGCILEQYAISRNPSAPGATGQWELTLETLRAAAIRHHLFGMKQYLFHGYYQTDGDERPIPFTNARWDFAPGINFEPWYEVFGDFATESARLSAFIFTAAPVCDAAMLFPRITRWAEEFDWEPYSTHSGFWLEQLSRAGLTFHLFDERELAEASVRDGKLHLGERGYSTIVLPGVAALTDGRLLDLLAQLVGEGGRVLSSGPTPHRSQQKGEDPQLAESFAALLANEHALHFDEPPTSEALAPLLVPTERPHVQTDGNGPLWQWAGHDGHGWRLALFNDSLQELPVSVVGAEACGFERWDCGGGEIAPSGPDHVLEPMELLCLRISPSSEGKPAREKPQFTVGQSVILDERWSIEVEEDDRLRPIDVTRGWEHQGLAGFSGSATYWCVFDLPAGSTTSGWRLELPAVETAAEVVINGTTIGRRGWRPYRFELPSDALHPQENELRIRVWNTAANRYYTGTDYGAGGPYASGITSPPILLQVGND